jgi:regulator of sigma E protease
MLLDVLRNPVNLLTFLTVVTALVAAHELGHYLFARWFKMEVEEFAIGFGRPKWVWRRGIYRIKRPVAGTEDVHETEFTLRPLPVGGFVRIKGMNPEDDGSEVSIPNGFYSKTPFARFMVLFAGPLFSILAGWLVLIPLWATIGVDKPSQEPVLEMMSKEEPAYVAGIRPGDRVLRLDGQPVQTFFDVVKYVRVRPGQPIKFEVDRKGEELTFTVTPKRGDHPTALRNEDMEPTSVSAIQGTIGASPGIAMTKLSWGEATKNALLLPGKMIDGIIGIIRNPRRFTTDTGGPVTILYVTSGAAAMGISRVLELAGLLSISLGIFNLLPIAPLDGGQMVVALLEMLRRGRRLSMKVQSAIISFGMVLVLTLMIAVFAVDITRFTSPQKPTPVATTNDKPEPKQETEPVKKD